MNQDSCDKMQKGPASWTPGKFHHKREAVFPAVTGIPGQNRLRPPNGEQQPAGSRCFARPPAARSALD